MLSGFMFTNLSLNSLQVNVLVFNVFLSESRDACSERNGGGEEQASVSSLCFKFTCHYYFSSLRCSEQTESVVCSNIC